MDMENVYYLHGSEDSTDIDIVVVFDEMPSFKDCQLFCQNKISTDKNIIVIKDGIIVQCHKGTPDELNNALIDTYLLHEQKYPLYITKRVERDILIKYVRAIRCILSHCSRSIYRNDIKKALHSPYLIDRIVTLETIDFNKINDFGKHGSIQDVYKILAFQLGQVLGLSKGIELYTKACISFMYEDLRPFIYRMNSSSPDILNLYVRQFCDVLRALEVIQQNEYSYFPLFDKTIDLKKEQYIF